MERGKKFLSGLGVAGLILLINSSLCFATPSTTYWTPCVSDVQPYGIMHIGVDNYNTLGIKGLSKGRGGFPTDYGLTMGVLPFEKLNLEVGVDLLEPTHDPVSFNGKLGTPEGSLFKESPALNVGIFNAGTKKDVTDANIVYFVLGKTLPFKLGRLHVSPYYFGNSGVLRDANGAKKNHGWMIGYDKFIYKDKIMLAADYASGRNAIGGGGVGVYYFFTKDISLLTGPVWFNDRSLNGNMKWTMQLDINFDAFSKLFKKK